MKVLIKLVKTVINFLEYKFKKLNMRTTSLFIICLLAMTSMAVDISDIDELNLLAMDSSDAFDDVMTLLNQLEAQSKGEMT